MLVIGKVDISPQECRREVAAWYQQVWQWSPLSTGQREDLAGVQKVCAVIASKGIDQTSMLD